MAIIKKLNSKAKIKQLTDADMPFQARQPVLAKGSAISTASQTIINLPWLVDTVNQQDSFFITVDGKLLTLGGSNDYTMTNLDPLGFSNQVTLTQSLTAGLNIQYWKQGFQKDAGFATNPFTQSETVININLGAAATIDWDLSSYFVGQMSTNCTLSFANAENGRSITLIVNGDAVTPYNITFPSMKKRGDFVSLVNNGKTNIYTITKNNGIIYASCVEDLM